jgi:hypothetical protein
MSRFLPLLLLLPGLALAQAPTPAAEGGPRPRAGVATPTDAGPAHHPPQTESPQVVNRGTDGSAIGLEQPGGTGITPQGIAGSATAGARAPDAPMGVPPPISRPN